MGMRKITVLLSAITLMLTWSNSANASNVFQELKELKWEDGRLRIEAQGWSGVRSGRRSRSGDIGVVGTVEKEFALYQKLTVGVRAIPIFIMDESDKDGRDAETIYGVGVGISIRRYLNGVEDGWYAEYNESIIGQSKKFRGNSGNFNFMSEIGIGYEFENDWYVSAKWRHLSNAGIANKNAGVNGVGIGIGFSF
jgi:hypothetical protein